MTTVTNLTEAELLEALRRGEDRAFKEAMFRYGGAMLSAARAISPNYADDAVQDAWISAYVAVADFEGRCSLKTWLVRITMNCVYNALRKYGKEVSLQGFEPEDDPNRDSFQSDGHWAIKFSQWHDETPQALLEACALQDCLTQHVAALPSGQRLALTLSDFERLPPEEISLTLNMTHNNFRVLLHRARAHIFAMVSHYQETGEC